MRPRRPATSTAAAVTSDWEEAPRRNVPQGPTQLLPRMVARMGTTSYNDEARFDFIDDLPELRPITRVAPPDEDHQVAILTELVRDHAALTRPDPASFPALALRVMDRAQDRRAGVDQIVSLVAQDLAVSAAVLRVCNSSLFHRGGAPVLNIRTAVSQIGLDEVRRIAAGVASRSLYDLEVVSEFELFRKRWTDLFRRSMTVAFSAGWLAAKLRTGTPERAFLAGMFHDVGKTIGLRSLSSLLMNGQLPFEPSDGAIDGMLEQVHVGIGVTMHEAWSLPEELTAICRLHHSPDLPPELDARDLHVVRLCGALDELQSAAAFHVQAGEVVRGCLRTLDISFKQYRLLTARVAAFSEQVVSMFNLPGAASAAASPTAQAS